MLGHEIFHLNFSYFFSAKRFLQSNGWKKSKSITYHINYYGTWFLRLYAYGIFSTNLQNYDTVTMAELLARLFYMRKVNRSNLERTNSEIV